MSVAVDYDEDLWTRGPGPDRRPEPLRGRRSRRRASRVGTVVPAPRVPSPASWRAVTPPEGLCVVCAQPAYTLINAVPQHPACGTPDDPEVIE